jgi:hypothetical protein
MTIWVVVDERGEYSDCYTEVIRAFRDQAAANSFAEDMTVRVDRRREYNNAVNSARNELLGEPGNGVLYPILYWPRKVGQEKYQEATDRAVEQCNAIFSDVAGDPREYELLSTDHVYAVKKTELK